MSDSLITTRRQGGSVGSDEPPRLPNGPLEVFRKLLYWLLLTPQIAVTSAEDCSSAASSFLVACTVRDRELFDSIDTP